MLVGWKTISLVLLYELVGAGAPMECFKVRGTQSSLGSIVGQARRIQMVQFGSQEFRAEVDKQVAVREEYDHRMVVA